MRKMLTKSKLEQLYWDEGKSVYKIAKELNIPKTTIERWLKVRGISTRNHWESLSNHISLNSKAMEFVDGNLLGDGSLVLEKERISPRLSFTVKYKEFLAYIKKCMCTYNIASGRIITKQQNGFGGGRIGYQLQSHSYIDFIPIHRRWYTPKKIVPDDLVLTPTKILWWFLGDGCFTKGNLYLCTDGFNSNDLDILIEKLEAISIYANKNKHGNSERLYIRRKSVPFFFEYIGNCPKEIHSIYGYKWVLGK